MLEDTMKKVHIIPHSHWDREWYMPYERHHMLLIELIDDLLELFENDPDYKCFHLDGQTICLDDYLEVKPEKRPILEKLVAEGKLKVGPFYILQDDFLTSSESNARNMLVGAIESKKWTDDYVKLGYFPDTFGNMGQTPQLMKEIGIEAAAFGRGVKPTGFGNQVFDNDKYSSNFSEMTWQGPDGSEILGLLFANWYSNGKEIPIDPIEAKQFWDKKLADVEKYASTDQLLMLNGSDHQPVQKNLSEAIKIANEIYPDVEFVHSDFDTYIAELKEELPQNLNVIEGEITSQETDGWTTLANTASSRVYLKQENTKATKYLEEQAEPLAVMAQKAGYDYPEKQLDFAWKMLMQNHPHDSICGCSLDEVHKEMMTRYQKTENVAQYIIDESARHLEKAINTEEIVEDDDSMPFVVFNTSSSSKAGVVDIELIYDRYLFTQKRESAATIFQELSDKPVPDFSVVDVNGKDIPIFEVSSRVDFNFDLPKDAFRQSYMNRFVKFSINMPTMKGYSWETFKLKFVESESEAKAPLAKSSREIETSLYNIQINQDGSLKILDKKTGHEYDDLLIFEDMGDLGNEYVFRAPLNDKAISTRNNAAKIDILENNSEYVKVKIVQTLDIPVSMDDQLLLEQRSHVDYRARTAKRSDKLERLQLETQMTVAKDNPTIQFKTSFDNQMRDHRLQVLFGTGRKTSKHYADSIFEVVSRNNQVSDKWKNPENPQHTHAFVNVHDDNGGMTVSNYGLNEYEVTRDGGYIKTTILRSVGELGDWGYFPTPEAQCLGKQEVSYGLTLHDANGFYASLHAAFSNQVPLTVIESSYHAGTLPAKQTCFGVNNEAVKVTALKKRNNDQQTVLRCYNLSEDTQKIELADEKQYWMSNLLEEQKEQINNLSLEKAQITTLLIEE